MQPRSVLATTFVLICVCAWAATPRADDSLAWLDRVNFYRATAGLPPVEEDPGLSGPVAEHARYMVEHDEIKHTQNRRRSLATRAGAEAAASSVLVGSNSGTEPDVWAVDLWMQGPFHALGLLDPSLERVGFGIQRDGSGSIQTAAALDVVRGRNTIRTPAFPVVWPANGATVPIGTSTTESPDPLATCREYSSPAGLPVIVQFGSGRVTPHVTASWFMDGKRALRHCVFDETNYRNGNKEEQRHGRSVLDAHDAVVLVPRDPLQFGRTYRVIIDANGKRIEWTFRVGH
ncbi:MAG TPA: CAP domain-containing protein [Vicinamibacterales bacterium]|nr:CAP domain-containing protein [Vicinamibacterales bacterium]